MSSAAAPFTTVATTAPPNSPDSAQPAIALQAIPEQAGPNQAIHHQSQPE